MRKTLSAIALVLVFVFAFTACDGKNKGPHIEPQVTMEQVNTSGEYVARAYMEALFTDNRAMFDKCYPEGFLEQLGESSGDDLYSQYRSVMKIDAVVNGTASTGYRDYTIANGFDEAGMRSAICFLAGREYSEIGRIQIQKVTVYFSKDTESASADFYYVVYEINGSWYMLEGCQNDVEF